MNDDGSGTALTMELARIFGQSGIDFDATLVFMCHVAEEQGLFGAHLHAQKAAAERIPHRRGLQQRYRRQRQGRQRHRRRRDDPRVLGGAGGFSVARARALRAALGRALRAVAPGAADGAARPVQPGRRPPAYNQLGFAAVGFRESRENFARQHDARDTFDGLSIPYLAQNARVNVAAAATIALAPPAPVVTAAGQDRPSPRAPSGYDANLKWMPSPGAVAYRIFWREAWGPDWQHDLLVGNVAGVVLPGLQIDDYVFGVAAVDAAGHESVVAPYVSPPRAPISVKTRSLDTSSSVLDAVDELADHVQHPLRHRGELDTRAVDDQFLIDVADVAMHDAAFHDHRAITERETEIVKGIQLQGKNRLDWRAAAADLAGLPSAGTPSPRLEAGRGSGCVLRRVCRRAGRPSGGDDYTIGINPFNS